MGDWAYFRIKDVARQPLPASSWPYFTSNMSVTLSHAPERVWIVYVSEGDSEAIGEFSYTFRPPFTWTQRDEPTRFFFPAYEGTNFLTGRIERLAGIALPAHDAAAFKGLSRMRDDAHLDLLQCVWLPSDLSRVRTHQRVGIPRTTENPRIPPFNIQECGR
jgi:hypothetical protein